MLPIRQPGPRYDRWILTSKDMIYTDVIVFDKQENAIFFREYKPMMERGNPTNAAEACIACHSSGLREIIVSRPVASGNGEGEEAALSPGELGKRRLAQFNDIIGGYGIADWEK